MMKCKGCGKKITEHGKFYIFEYEQYYPGGASSDLTLISSDMNERKSKSTFDEVLYACGNTIFDAVDGEEIKPWDMN